MLIQDSAKICVFMNILIICRRLPGDKQKIARMLSHYPLSQPVRTQYGMHQQHAPTSYARSLSPPPGLQQRGVSQPVLTSQYGMYQQYAPTPYARSLSPPPGLQQRGVSLRLVRQRVHAQLPQRQS